MINIKFDMCVNINKMQSNYYIFKIDPTQLVGFGRFLGVVRLGWVMKFF